MANSSKTFAEAAASYVEHGGDAKYISRLTAEIGGLALDAIIPFDIKQLALHLFPHQSNSTRNRGVLTPVSAVLNHAHERGWGPVIRLGRFKENRPVRRRAASQIWLHEFVRQCDKDDLPHVAALVLFMSQTGARVSEAIDLKWSDFDLSTRSVVLRKVKNQSNAVRFFADNLVGRLFELQRASTAESRAFKYKCRHSVNERIKAVCQRADLPYKPSHTCGRHAMANNALELGVDIKTTMIAGGWRSTAVFLDTYVNPRNSGRLVADRFNSYQYDADI